MNLEPILALQLAQMQLARLQVQARHTRQRRWDHIERHPQAQWAEKAYGPGLIIKGQPVGSSPRLPEAPA